MTTLKREVSAGTASTEAGEIVKVYEQMTSGRKWGRLAQLLEDAEDKLFDVVVFLKMDRFGRSTRDILNAHGGLVAEAQAAVAGVGIARLACLDGETVGSNV